MASEAAFSPERGVKVIVLDDLEASKVLRQAAGIGADSSGVQQQNKGAAGRLPRWARAVFGSGYTWMALLMVLLVLANVALTMVVVRKTRVITVRDGALADQATGELLRTSPGSISISGMDVAARSFAFASAAAGCQLVAEGRVTLPVYLWASGSSAVSYVFRVGEVHGCDSNGKVVGYDWKAAQAEAAAKVPASTGADDTTSPFDTPIWRQLDASLSLNGSHVSSGSLFAALEVEGGGPAAPVLLVHCPNPAAGVVADDTAACAYVWGAPDPQTGDFKLLVADADTAGQDQGTELANSGRRLNFLWFGPGVGAISTGPASFIPVITGGINQGRRATIICTHLHSLGLLPSDVLAGDQLFGGRLHAALPAAYQGYLLWARPLIRLMTALPRGFTEYGVAPVVRVWARHAAALVGHVSGVRSMEGGVLMGLGVPLCVGLGWAGAVLPAAVAQGLGVLAAGWVVVAGGLVHLVAVVCEAVCGAAPGATAGVALAAAVVAVTAAGKAGAGKARLW